MAESFPEIFESGTPEAETQPEEQQQGQQSLRVKEKYSKMKVMVHNYPLKMGMTFEFMQTLFPFPDGQLHFILQF